MLGTEQLKKWYAQQDSIQAKPKVIAEWNSNALSKPYIYGDGTGTFVEVSTISGLTPATGSLGGSSKKFTITAAYTTNTTATEYSFTPTIATPAAGKSYKLSFFATADKVIDLLVIATAKDSSGNILEQSSSTFSLGPAKNESFIVDCNSYNLANQINTMEYTVSVINDVYTSTSVSITLDSIRMYTVNSYEMATNAYLSLKDVFSINRPGDAYINGGAPGNGNVSPYNIAWQSLLKKSSDTATFKSVRNFFASTDAAFKYYLYGGQTTKTVFAKYESKSLINKLILKVNSKQTIPSSVKIYTLTSKDGDFSGSADATVSTPFDANGLAQIYWTGSTWSTSSWAGGVPTYIDQSVSLSREIYGIKVEFTSTTGEVHLVEISPRLELDLSSYVRTFSITNELSNDSLPTPVGVANSDTATVELENLPVYSSGQYLQPFDNYTGVLAGLLKKNVIFRIIISTNIDGTWVDQQIAKMITTAWSNNGIDTCSVELFDSIKTLSQIKAPSMYFQSVYIGKALSYILDSVGFTDYDYDALSNISEKILNRAVIEHYWTVSQSGSSVLEALQSILLPYQIAMYTDPYGVIVFKHISQIVESEAETVYKITSQDTGSGESLIKSNIIDFTINDENTPSKARVEYANISPSTFTDLSLGIRRAGNEQINNVFPNEVLGLVSLSKELSANARSMEVIINDRSQNQSYIDSHSGYLLLDSEIIKFDGIEYKFIIVKTNGQTETITKVLKNKSEINSIRSEYLSSQNVSAIAELQPGNSTRILKNLTRGCFGTKVEKHTVGSSTSDFTFTSGAASSNGSFIKLNKTNSVIRYTSASAQNTCTSNTKLFSGSFAISDNTQIPTTGTAAEFGLHLGSTDGSNNDAIKIGLSFYRKQKNPSTVTYTYNLIVKQYDASGAITSTKEYVLEKYDVDAKGNGISKKNYMINTYGENSIVAMFISESATNLANKLCIMINGNIISFDGSTEKAVIMPDNALSSTSKKIEFPAIKLVESKDFSGSKLAVYNNGVIPVNLTELQGFSLPSGADKDSRRKILNILSTVMYGNLLGLSNKDELESVASGVKVAPVTEGFGFKAKSVGREIKLIEADFTQSKFPVLYSHIIREPYVQQVLNPTTNVIDTVNIPSDSITFSRINHSPTSARFAMINSYSEPVLINGETYGAYNDVKSITKMFGAILSKNSMSNIDAKINDDNSDTSISISSDWIQNENAASKVLSYIINSSIMKNNSINVEVFGNPLISVGDVLNVNHHLKNFTGKYAVVSTTKDFDNGINTSISLRRVSA